MTPIGHMLWWNGPKYYSAKSCPALIFLEQETWAPGGWWVTTVEVDGVRDESEWGQPESGRHSKSLLLAPKEGHSCRGGGGRKGRAKFEGLTGQKRIVRAEAQEQALLVFKIENL